MAMAQIKRPTPGRDYPQRNRAAGNTRKEAMRCLKRGLADVVYHTMIHDTETLCCQRLDKRGAVRGIGPALATSGAMT